MLLLITYIRNRVGDRNSLMCLCNRVHKSIILLKKSITEAKQKHVFWKLGAYFVYLYLKSVVYPFYKGQLSP